MCIGGGDEEREGKRRGGAEVSIQMFLNYCELGKKYTDTPLRARARNCFKLLQFIS